jgi:putative DNA primase/helicase
MNSAARQFNDLSEDDIRAALAYIDANDRATWVRMAMAVKHELGPSGWNIWDTWSQTSGEYNAKDARDVWKSAKETGSSGTVTIGTLIAEAQSFGFKFNEQDREPISQHEIEERQQRRDAATAAAKERLDRDRAAAAQRAQEMLDAAVDVEASEHPYLERKGVQGFGLKIGEWRKGLNNVLLVPLRLIDGKLVSLQGIFANASPMFDGKDRDFLPGGQKRGAFHMIGGKPYGSEPVILVAEGFATGASAHQATGHFVAVALDAGNLLPVATALRNIYPLAVIVILGDDDKWTKDNPGMHHAHQAAQTAAALMVMPKFADLASKPTDFNDLHALEGIDAVRKQIEAALPKKAANDNGPAVALDSPINPMGYPHISEKGQPLNTVENLAFMMGQYGITARYNMIRKAVELKLPGRSYSTDNRANASLAEITSISARNRMPQAMLQDYIKLIADAHAFNPVCDWIESKPWDGVERIKQLQATITTGGDAALKDALMYRWLLSAVAAVFMPTGFEGHGCLVLTGAQGSGKTTWFRRLAPSELVLVGAMLDPADKDTVTNAVSHWIVELGELDATFRKADIARLKSFIPKPVDKLRRPYDRVESEYQRRTVFGASVNEDRYLVDDTGNRRWWTINVQSIDYQHKIDMQQVWAEVLVHFLRGEQHYLTPEENDSLGKLNTEHEAVDPVEEIILSAFEWENRTLHGFDMTASEVLIAIGFDKPNKSQATHASKVLKKLTGKEPKRKASGRYFEMPSKPKGMRRNATPAPGSDDDLKPY